MPLDDGFQVFHYDEGADSRILEGSHRRIAKAESAHHDVEIFLFQCAEAELGQLTLRLMKQTGHEEVVTQLDFVNVKFTQSGYPPTPQDEVPEGSWSEVQFLEDQAVAFPEWSAR